MLTRLLPRQKPLARMKTIKKSDPKNRKNCKNRSEISACEQKTTSEKANFCSNTVFSLHLKFRANKLLASKPLAFSLHFLFRPDKNHYSNLTSKIMKMYEQIFKKRQRPNTMQILWIVKKTKSTAIYLRSAYSFAAIKRQSPNTFQFLDCKNESAEIIAFERLTAAINNQYPYERRVRIILTLGNLSTNCLALAFSRASSISFWVIFSLP